MTNRTTQTQPVTPTDNRPWADAEDLLSCRARFARVSTVVNEWGGHDVVLRLGLTGSGPYTGEPGTGQLTGSGNRSGPGRNRSQVGAGGGTPRNRPREVPPPVARWSPTARPRANHPPGPMKRRYVETPKEPS